MAASRFSVTGVPFYPAPAFCAQIALALGLALGCAEDDSESSSSALGDAAAAGASSDTDDGSGGTPGPVGAGATSGGPAEGASGEPRAGSGVGGAGRGMGGAGSGDAPPTDTASMDAGEPGSGGNGRPADSGLPPLADAAVMTDEGLEQDAAAGGDTGGAVGVSVDGGAAGESADEVPSGYVPGIVAVGYGGLRVVSRDDGQSWSDAVDLGQANADDQNLLRAVTYGKGRWIATGWRLMYSDDGVEWVDYSMVRDEFGDQSIIEGLAYKEGYFYAAGDPGKFYRSEDGLHWEHFGETIGNTQKHTALSFRGGKFVAFGDSHTSFTSTDGLVWSELGIANGTYCDGEWRSLSDCHDAAWFEPGFYLHAEWGGQIRRSTTGSNFQNVYEDPDEHTAYKSFTFARGYVRP
jgi:hypothetical protein